MDRPAVPRTCSGVSGYFQDLCFSGASFTSRPCPVRNPWDPTRIAGGSSSGCAALVGSGAVDLAVGGDQGGSVRMPSSFCGTVGHKPTHGLVPYTGAFPSRPRSTTWDR